MKKIFLICLGIFIFLNLINLVFAGSVVRNLSSENPLAGEEIEVTLIVDFDEEDLSYYIQEEVPVEAEVVDKGSVMTWDGNILRMGGDAQTQGDFSYTYKIKFSAEGVYDFGEDISFKSYDGYIMGDVNVVVGAPCIPNWTRHEENCSEAEYEVTWFEDENSCGQARENETEDCDFDGNGIIGNVSDVETEEVDDLEIWIDDDKLDLDAVYDEELWVEFYDDEDLLLSFEYDFEDEPLNLRKIYVEKQGSRDDFGFLLVNGLEDVDKEFWIEIVDEDSEYVCVRDREIFDIDDMTDKCTSRREELLECPGNKSDFECRVEDGFFVVNYLEHSAVKEMHDFDAVSSGGDDDDGVCNPDWDCDWSGCSNGVKTYRCVDVNSCGDISSRPSAHGMTNTCGSVGGDTPPASGGDEEKEEDGVGKIIFIIVIVMVVLILIVIGIVFWAEHSRKKKQEEAVTGQGTGNMNQGQGVMYQ